MKFEKEYRAKDAPASTGTVTVHRRCANGSVPSRVVATPLPTYPTTHEVRGPLSPAPLGRSLPGTAYSSTL